MTKTVTSMTMTMKPAEICQMPATMHTGLTVKQADTPKTIATREEKDFANIWARKDLIKEAIVQIRKQISSTGKISNDVEMVHA